MFIGKYEFFRAGYKISLKFRLWPESWASGSGDGSSWSSCHDICLISKSSDSKWGSRILSKFWNPNSFFQTNLIDDLETSKSWDIFPTEHAIFSRKQINIISICLALAGLILWASLQLSLTPILPCLIFFARIFTVHREVALSSSTSTSNQWLSIAVHPIILPNAKNFHFFSDFQKS